MPQLSLLRLNPLAFPGRSPGFDPSHPAAEGISPGFGYSAAATTSGNLIHLLTGVPFAKHGVSFPTASMLAQLGPCGLVDNTAKSVQITGQATTTPPGVTCGALVQFSGTGDGSYCGVIGFNASVAGQFGMKGTAQNLYFFGTPERDSTFTIALNTPYFIAGSTSSVATNFVAVNLLTGAVLSSTAAGQTMAANSATQLVGSDFGGTHYSNAYIATAMCAQAYMPMPALLTWAADPWAFWYPRSVLYSLDWMTAGVIVPTLPPPVANLLFV